MSQTARILFSIVVTALVVAGTIYALSYLISISGELSRGASR